MESVYVGTTQQVNTARCVPLSTTTGRGSLRTGLPERLMNVKSVNATDMPTVAFLTGRCGGRLVSVVEVCVTVCTTQRVVSVKGASPASTETHNGRPLLRIHANPVNVTHWDPCPST